MIRTTTVLLLLVAAWIAYCQDFQGPAEKYMKMYSGPVIECTEISGYMVKLKEFLNGECEKLDDGCPWKVRKALKWYARVAKQIDDMCKNAS